MNKDLNQQIEKNCSWFQFNCKVR